MDKLAGSRKTTYEAIADQLEKLKAPVFFKPSAGEKCCKSEKGAGGINVSCLSLIMYIYIVYSHIHIIYIIIHMHNYV